MTLIADINSRGHGGAWAADAQILHRSSTVPRSSSMSGAEPQRGAQPQREPQREPLFGDCWSCRVLSGSALLLSGAYVFSQARKVMRTGHAASMGTVAQITFAVGLAAWGVVVMTDPVGKAQRKN